MGIRALQELKRAGTIKAFGLGVNETEICMEGLDLLELDLILLANRYTLIDRTGEAGLLARCQKLGVNLVIGGVFNSDILAAPDSRTATFDYRTAGDDTVRLVSEVQAICRAYGTDIVTAALNFPLCVPTVTSVLVGTSRVLNQGLCE